MKKASGGDGIPVELFQHLRDDAVKVLHSKYQQIWKNSAVAIGLEKLSFHSNPTEGQCQRMFKLSHNCTHFTCQQSNAQNCSSWAQQFMNQKLPDAEAGFRKGRRTRDQIAQIHWIIEKAREFQKTIYLCFIDYAKAFDCVDHCKLGQGGGRNARPPYLPPETPVCRSRSTVRTVEQWTGSKFGKYNKSMYCHPAHLTYMQSTF